MLAAFLPPLVVTSTLAPPGVPSGVMQVIVVLLTTVNSLTALPPMVTLSVNAKFVPVIVTALPPAGVPPTVMPSSRTMAVTVGSGSRYDL